MAIGFIKKIFSFGKDTVEEKPLPPQEAPVAPVADEAAGTPSVPAASAEDDRTAIEEAKSGADEIAPSAERAPEVETGHEEARSEIDVVIEGESVPHPISPLVGEMPGRAVGGEAPSEDAPSAGEVAIPPSVPSGHLPHKGGDQGEIEAAADNSRTVVEEAEAGGAGEIAPTAEPAPDEVGTRSEEVDESVAIDGEGAPHPISPLVGEMPGRAEGGAPSADQAALRDEAAPSLPKGFAAADKRPQEAVPAAQPKLSWYQRLRRGLARTSSQLTGQIASLFTKRKLDEATLQELEDLLIQADLGVETAMRITDALSSERYGKDVTGEDVSRIMAGEITKVLAPVAKPLELDLSHKPHVILVVGVNGTGKTTTIGKLAAKLSGAGLKVMLAAGDTFRAAAIEQLKIWAERTKSDIVASKLGADAAGLAYEAYQLAREKKSDVLIIDTAGRLQNKAELMAELEKIVRVLGKLDPDAPHTVLQTLDATTGQNALQQVEIFRNVAGVSGLIMTKLDGTARGGILVAISAKHKLPVYFIGVGEGVDDLEPFEAKDFAEAIAGVAAG
ncbi:MULTISPECIES: signal recognition particle-docking protein FtsY [Sinorhizobium]|uniref:signal recognition particle-docking protein FtsY n=1 Tax=Sinorhizobium TaxID=28105 RepID=UPI000BE9069C|nr:MULTISPECIES: signal recognition particle-docking protein FtsY [Sinorhizobium]PDT51907.1 signal recognition particle-docking protein FtsY [Sinorhizobium sp. NG07B]POH27224.1 signal recognition particle-docking protein FtsY [Sinorhizobium americanum]